MSVVRERMLPRQDEIAGLGLTFAVSSGWMPGLTELLPAHAYAQAKTKMDSIESVAVYFSDSGEWSDNALRDAVAYLRESGLPKPGYFHRGSWKPVKQLEASIRADPCDPIGVRRFTIFSLAEQKDLGPHLNDCDFRTYSYLAGFQNAIAAVIIALLPISEAACVRMMRNVFRRNRLPVGGFVAVDVLGRAGGRRRALNLRMVFEHGRDYWANAIVMSTTARMIAAGNHVKPGVHFLFDAVEPSPFLAELTKSGVNIVETYEERE